MGMAEIGEEDPGLEATNDMPNMLATARCMSRLWPSNGMCIPAYYNPSKAQMSPLRQCMVYTDATDGNDSPNSAGYLNDDVSEQAGPHHPPHDRWLTSALFAGWTHDMHEDGKRASGMDGTRAGALQGQRQDYAYAGTAGCKPTSPAVH